jgi:hypothetical protein
VSGGRGTRSSWYLAVNLAAVAILAAAVLLLRQAEVVGERIELFGHVLPESCLYKQVHGRPCFGCGMTRSLALAVAGRLADSLAVHASGVWMAGYLLVQVVARVALVVIRPGGAWVWRVDLGLSLPAMLLAVYLPVALAIG